MPAYFSSKFTNQFHAAFTAALLVFCLLGTHWVGFSHGISHAQVQSHAEIDTTQSDKQTSLNHSSDICHLFDALTLAGFAVSKPLADVAYSFLVFVASSSGTSILAQISNEHYQSRAPPNLHL
jgi:hypothetical protein